MLAKRKLNTLHNVFPKPRGLLLQTFYKYTPLRIFFREFDNFPEQLISDTPPEGAACICNILFFFKVCISNKNFTLITSL